MGRLIQGQHIGTDFNAYLGWLLDYALYLLTSLFGGTFAASKIAAYFLSASSFVFIVSMGLYLGGVSKKVALAIATSIVFLYSLPAIQIALYHLLELTSVPTGVKPLRFGLAFLTQIDPGVSLRTVRPVCLFVSVSLLLSLEKPLLARPSPFTASWAFVSGIAAGLCGLWSTDFGMPSALATLLLTVLLQQMHRPTIPDWKAALTTGALSGCVALTIFYLLSFALAGRTDAPLLWWGYLRSISAASYAYFDLAERKVFSLSALQWPLILLGFGASLGALALFRLKRQSTWLAASLMLACLTAAGTLSSIVNVNQPDCFRASSLLSFCFIVGYLLTLGAKKICHRPWWQRTSSIRVFLPIGVLAIMAAVSLIQYTVFCVRIHPRVIDLGAAQLSGPLPAKMSEFWHSRNRARLVEVPELGGYLSTSYADEIRMARSLRKSGVSSLWASYPGFYDTMIGTANETRFDYLLHAPGPENQREILEHLSNHPPDRIITINPDYTSYEDWLRAQNWSVYETILRGGYRIVDRTPMVLVWKRSATKACRPARDGEAEILSASASESKIRIPGSQISSVTGNSQAGPEGLYLLIDIEYSATPQKHLLFKSHVQVEPAPGRMGFGLETGAHVSRRIPLLINKEGDMEITIKARPEGTVLKILSASWSVLKTESAEVSGLKD